MGRMDRSKLAAGIVFILVGAGFLLAQIYPTAFQWLDLERNWPLIIVGAGIVLLVFAAVTQARGLAVLGCLAAGIGGLLAWQNATGNWESWAYVWALIPGFVGVGVILAGIFSGDGRRALRDGGRTVLFSLVLFAFAAALFAGGQLWDLLWPSLLIAAGAMLLVGSLSSPRRES